MANGDTASIIIAICVTVPAVIAICVCVIVFYSHRNKDRKLYRQRSTSDEYHHSSRRVPQDNYIIDVSRSYRSHQQRRIREPSPVFEQPPLSYDNAINQTTRQQLPLFSPIRTTPSTTHVHRVTPVITPSVYSSMPPSYAEIFLTPHRLTNQ